MGYPHYPADCDHTEAVREAMTDFLHPEFGTGWQEPDGELHKAHQAGREQALDDVITLLKRTDAMHGWAWSGDKAMAIEYVQAWREGRTPHG